MTFVVAVPAYRRPRSLRRVLRSIEDAAKFSSYWPDLFIRLDYDGSVQNAECLSVAREFVWGGRKEVIPSSGHLGLHNNVMACGDLSGIFGAVLVVEEDLCLSPAAFSYALQAIEHYKESESVACISLYSQIYNEFADLPFVPLDDGADVYFAMTGSSWGQIWTSRMWSGFLAWFQRSPDFEASDIPDVVRSWPKATSWKRAFNMYIAANRLYVVFPRFAMSTNMGEVGEHFPRPKTHLTAPLSLRRSQFKFSSVETSLSRYDQYLEIEPDVLKALVPSLCNYEFSVGLTGNGREAGSLSPMILTLCSRKSSPLVSYGMRHYPLELNCILGEGGTGIGLIEAGKMEPAYSERLRPFLRHFFLR